MPRTTRPLLLVPFVAAALLGAGCSTTVPGTAAPVGGGTAAPPAAQAPTDDPVAWTDRVCQAVLPLAELSETETAPPTGPGQLDEISDRLTQLDTATGESIENLGTVGPSPLPNGDQLVTDLTATLTTLQEASRAANEALTGADPNDPADLAQVLEPLEEVFNGPDPLASLEDDPALRDAYEQAPTCQQLEGTN